MPTFGKSSASRLATCHPNLQELFNEVIKNYDCSILQGTRSKEEQDEYFRTGKSKVQYPNSKHNHSPSLAVDVVPYPIDWNDWNRFYHFTGYVKGVADKLGIDIRSGIDWDSDNDFSDQSWIDAPHFEVKE
ncbi:MAG: M15 family peptidase [Pseudomonadota bacterium]